MKTSLKRYLSESIKEIAFASDKMAFVSGPRQCGKTYVSKQLLKERELGKYYNWDDSKFRRMWVKDPSLVIPTERPAGKKDPKFLLVFDEIHKAKKWKQTIKGLFDTLEEPTDILVTGSAKLAVYRKGGDSLFGRYYHFRLHPLSVAELAGESSRSNPWTLVEELFDLSRGPERNAQDLFEGMLRFGDFPEPFLSQNEKKARLWRANRLELVIRQDLRDLSRIPELSQIEMLCALLPDTIGSLFSVTSLQEDLEVSYGTIRRWLSYLKELYYLFEVKPYTRQIRRSIRKAPKIYLWDFSEIESPAARFENLIACHLLKACHFWSDTGEGQFDLSFLRKKEGSEIDFLITKDKKPWLPIEVKLEDTSPSKNWQAFVSDLKLPYGVQVVAKKDVAKLHKFEKGKILVLSASRLLSYLV